MEYYSVTKMNCQHAAAWMNLMLSERRQSQMTTYCDSIDTDSLINQTLLRLPYQKTC